MSTRVALLIAMLMSVSSGPVAAADDDPKIAFDNHCRNCHSIHPDDNRLGPAIFGIVGAKAEQAKGFRGYSGGLQGIVWDELTLDRFIANPTSVSPTTNMIYPPVADPNVRKKIITYLKGLKN